MDNDDFRNLIAFCILMEGNGGIVEKAPNYVTEKFARRDLSMLDDANLAKYFQYVNKWTPYLPREEERHGN